MPVPDSTTRCIMIDSWLAWVIASDGCWVEASSTTVRSLPTTDSTRYGCMTMPRLAMAAVIIATCSGVIRTSRWPMADWARTSRLSSSAGKDERATDIGTRSASPMPKRAAWSRRASSPMSMPSDPNAVLHEIRSASTMRWVPDGSHSAPP